jgi:hypothetical protein
MTRIITNWHRSHRTFAACFAMAWGVGLVAASSGYAQVAVTSSTLVERTAAPGETYRGAITIHNSSDTVQVVSFSLADYSFSADGSTTFDEPGSQPRSNTSWIALGQRAVSVLPHADAAVTYTVAVPSTTSPSGTYWSVVLVEAVRAGDASPSSAGLAIATRFRYAVQLATHIGSTGEPTLAFGAPNLLHRAFGVEVIAAGGGSSHKAVASLLAPDYTLALDITHAGTRACRPTLRLEVYQTDGTLAHSASAQRGLLYPGTSVSQTFELGSLSPGDYMFLLLADVGGDKVQGTKFPVHIR